MVFTEFGTLEKGVEKSQEERVEMNHVSDSLTLLLYLGLLILTLLTLWLFKHRKLRYIHETGLAIIYGLIVGAIIRYSSKPREISIRAFSLISGAGVDNVATSALALLSNGTPAPVADPLPPEKVLLSMIELSKSGNQTRVYEYDYAKRLLNDVSTHVLSDKTIFNPEVFFHVILPPIIFCAGYSMKRKHFFSNIGAILTLAFIGTTISCVAVGSVVYGFTRLSKSMSSSVLFTDCLLFGAIISATDPVTVLAIFNDLHVDVDLFALVFGESVLNDAVAIVLAQSVEKYDSLISNGAGGFQGVAIVTAVLNFLGVFFGALAIGSAMGCLTALITKFTMVRDHPLLECSLFILMSYSTFLAAEAARSTGIVAVLFCGICQAHYTYNNLSRQTKSSTKTFFELLNFLAENFTFAYIGVTTFTYRSHVWDPVFIASAFAAILIGRALNIYPLCCLLNLGRRNRIGANKMHMLMFSGLRGAMAFALAIRNTSTVTRRMLFSTTLVIVIATVLLCGGLAAQMLQWMRIRVGVDEESGMDNPAVVPANASAEGDEDLETDGSGLPVGADRCHRTAAKRNYQGRLARSWHLLDSRFLKPLLTHARPILTETCPTVCLPLARLLTTNEQLTRASVHRDLISDPMEDERPITAAPCSAGFPSMHNGNELGSPAATFHLAANAGASAPVFTDVGHIF